MSRLFVLLLLPLSVCVCEGVMAVALSPLAPDPGYEHTTDFFPKGNSAGEGWWVEGWGVICEGWGGEVIHQPTLT